jgi:hypothetical protein
MWPRHALHRRNFFSRSPTANHGAGQLLLLYVHGAQRCLTTAMWFQDTFPRRYNVVAGATIEAREVHQLSESGIFEHEGCQPQTTFNWVEHHELSNMSETDTEPAANPTDMTYAPIGLRETSNQR